MTNSKQKPTIIELIQTAEEIGITGTAEEAQAFVDSKKAGVEYENFCRYVRDSTDGALECFYAEARPKHILAFGRLYKKVTKQPFTIDNVIRNLK